MTNKGFILSADQFFEEMVDDGFKKRKIKAHESVKKYLVGVLEHHLDVKNLFESEVSETGEKNPQTLAEMYLASAQMPPTEKHKLLKKLGDRSLYISGFFADSLQGKIVDVDYYANMGEVAYGTLADFVKEDLTASVYRTFSTRFLEFVDVLSYISHSSMIQNDQNILSLYDRFMKTGSEVAKEKLIEMGVLNVSADLAKRSRQD